MKVDANIIKALEVAGYIRKYYNENTFAYFHPDFKISDERKAEIKRIQDNIKNTFFAGSAISYSLKNNDGEGMVVNKTLVHKDFGIMEVEIYELRHNLTADTNFGVLDLVEVIDDTDDWEDIEQCLFEITEN